MSTTSRSTCRAIAGAFGSIDFCTWSRRRRPVSGAVSTVTAAAITPGSSLKVQALTEPCDPHVLLLLVDQRRAVRLDREHDREVPAVRHLEHRERPVPRVDELASFVFASRPGSW